MQLDVFKGDAFNLTTLSTAINLLPYSPTRLGRLGLFSREPITTTTVQVEMQGEVLALVANRPRGAPGTPVVPERRKVRNFAANHLPLIVTLLADEVQNLRAFGKDSDEETASALLQRKIGIARRRVELTQEFHRIGAVRGQVLDADGTTVLTDLFTEFGVAQQTLSMALGTGTTKVLEKVITAKRMVEDELGGQMSTGLRAECSPEFFDAFTSHPLVRDAFVYYQSTYKSSDLRDGFSFGGVLWEEYRGQVGSTRFVEAGAAYLVPEGVPDMFVEHYAPAPYMETVNTLGMPWYAKVMAMDYDKGVTTEVQSNPLVLNNRPRAVPKLTIS